MTKGRLRGIIGLGVLILTAAIYGCTGNADGPHVIQRENVRVLVAGPTDLYRQVEYSGKLKLGAGGCLGLSRDGTTTRIMMWPSGTRLIDDNPVTLEIPGAGRIALGQEIRAAGGQAMKASKHYPEVPEECQEGNPGAIDQAKSVSLVE